MKYSSILSYILNPVPGHNLIWVQVGSSFPTEINGKLTNPFKGEKNKKSFNNNNFNGHHTFLLVTTCTITFHLLGGNFGVE